jgi:hypothetical protein
VPGLLLSDNAGYGRGEGETSVEVVGGEIVVTKLGTTFLLAYRKSAEEPRLVRSAPFPGDNKLALIVAPQLQQCSTANAVLLVRVMRLAIA